VAVRQYNQWIMNFPNVLGCGVGRRTVGGRETDEVSVVVFVIRKLPLSALRSEEVIPRELLSYGESVLTDVVEIGEPRFAVDTNKYRPLKGGCQIVTASGAGTLGAIVYDAIDYEPLLLTCNHVVTMTGQRNQIPANNRVSQPSSNPVGRTKRIVPWMSPPLGAYYAWDAPVDAAVISVDDDVAVRFEVIDLGKHPFVILPPYEGLEVTKRGSISDQTTADVKVTDITMFMTDFDGKQVKVGGDNNVFSIQRDGVTFCSPGDSGSLVIDSALGSARGLFFGGDMTSGGTVFACTLSSIFSMLQVETPAWVACTARSGAPLPGGPRRSPPSSRKATPRWVMRPAGLIISAAI
jgi:hypothetical protein